MMTNYQTQQQQYLPIITDDILLHVFEFTTNARDLINFGKVSRQWNACSNETLKLKLKSILKLLPDLCLNKQEWETDNFQTSSYFSCLLSLQLLCTNCNLCLALAINQRCAKCSGSDIFGPLFDSPTLWASAAEAMNHFALTTTDVKKLATYRVTAATLEGGVQGLARYYFPISAILKASLAKHGGLEDIVIAIENVHDRKRKREDERNAESEQSAQKQNKRRVFLQNELKRKHDIGLNVFVSDALEWIHSGELPQDKDWNLISNSKPMTKAMKMRDQCSTQSLEPIFESQLKANALKKMIEEYDPKVEVKGYDLNDLMKNDKLTASEAADHVRYARWLESKSIPVGYGRQRALFKFVAKDIKWLTSSKKRATSLLDFETYWSSFEQRHEVPSFAKQDLQHQYFNVLLTLFENYQ